MKVEDFVCTRLSDEPENTRNFIGQILELDAVRHALKFGGWVSGGSIAYALHSGERGLRFYGESLRGDVDIFFNNHQVALTAAGSFEDYAKSVPNRPANLRYNSMVSPSKFAVNICPRRNYWDEKAYRETEKYVANVQYITHQNFCSPTPIHNIASFDLIASMAATDGCWLWRHKDLQSLQSQRTLRVARSDTPFLATRVIKYLTSDRGYESLEEGSNEKVHEWFYRAVTDSFPGFEKKSVDSYHVMRKLWDRGMMDPGMLPLLIGKITDWERSRETYGGRSFKVDWATKKIAEFGG